MHLFKAYSYHIRQKKMVDDMNNTAGADRYKTLGAYKLSW